MPLPKPSKTELRSDFINRCMSNDEAVAEFMDSDQRLAVCTDLWNQGADEEQKQESFDDYPKSASRNAQRAINFKKENGSDCGTPVGWTRASQLANREPISLDTVKRTYSFLSRAETYYTESGSLEECGNIMYLAWGGLSMKAWCESKLENLKFYNKTMKTKAKPEELSIGDTVRWQASGGEANGIIRRIILEDYQVPETTVTISGSEDDPAYEIEVLEEQDGSYVPTGRLVGHKASALEFVDLEVNKSLSQRFDLYKKGLAEAPRIIVQKSLTLDEEGKPKAILTREIMDRDGEVVMVDGIEIKDAVKGIPLLDSHAMTESVVSNVVGRAINLYKSEKDGKMQLEGSLKFAPTKVGQEAQKLVDGGFVDTVSIGFSVKEYDHETKRILKSELYEVSLVAVPANPEATISIGKSVSKLSKEMEHYKSIKPVVAEFRKAFLSETFCKTIGYEKTGDELVDIASIYNIVLDKLSVDSVDEVETPQVKTQKKDDGVISYTVFGKPIA